MFWLGLGRHGSHAPQTLAACGNSPTKEHDMPGKYRWCVRRMVFCAGMLAVLAGCQQQPDRWAAAQKASTQNPKAVSTEAVAGAEFNRFFPQVQAPWDIVFKQEKAGFAQVSLQQEGREVAVMSVFDTR